MYTKKEIFDNRLIIKDFLWVTSGIRTHDIQNHNPIESNRMQLVANKLNIAHKNRLKQSWNKQPVLTANLLFLEVKTMVLSGKSASVRIFFSAF